MASRFASGQTEGSDEVIANLRHQMFDRMRSLPALCSAVVVAVALSSSQLAVYADDWVDMRAFGPFICRADFALEGYEQVFADLAQIQKDIVRILNVPPAEERVEIYLFGSRAAYDRYLKQWYPNVPYRRALYVKNKGPGIVLAYNSSSLPIDMRHECTHALLHASLPMVPLWLDEGLAEYFENPVENRTDGSPHRSGMVWSIRLGQIPSITRLEAKRDLSEMGRREYRAAWAWVHFLLHGPPEAHDELVRYLSDIRSLTPPGQFSERLGRRVEDSHTKLVRHFKSLD